MEMDVFRGGDNSCLCASGIASPGLGIAFDLQLFNESQALVHTVDGKVTLDFTLYQEMKNYDVTDEKGRIYGTGSWGAVTLVSPPEGASPIEAAVNSAKAVPEAFWVYNSKYLGEAVTCKSTGRDNGSNLFEISFCYGENGLSDKLVVVKAAPGQTAEAVYRHSSEGDCWAESVRNGVISFKYGSYGILPNGTRVVSLSKDLWKSGDCDLTVDSEGNATVSGEVYLESGVFQLSSFSALLCEDA
ncbi:MAG: hypothetical protein IKH16_04395, partial [Selenomonadaceae bacterium]|nr:hypothetical protein [Selenomonadaceae bacterium]